MDHILMLVHSDYLNDHRVRREAETLAEHGYRVSCACTGENIPESHNGVRLLSYSPVHQGGKRRFLEVIRWFGTVIRSHDHTILHAHDLDALTAAGWYGKPDRIPVVYDSHELYLDSISLHNRRLTRFIWSLSERRFIRKATGVITVCDSIADILQRKYGLDKRPAVIRNFPDKPVPGKDQDGSAFHRVKKLHTSFPFLLLYHGVIRESRGLRFMIDLIEKLGDWGGVICGDGPLLPELRKIIEEKELQDRIVCTGHIKQGELPAVAELCSAGLCYIEPDAPSYAYALPNKLSEYVQTGLPVIGSRLPEISRIIDSYEIGYTIETGEGRTVQALHALKMIRENPDRFREALFQAARELNWETEKARLLHFYDEILNRSGKS